jgi:hypothetical protein
MGKERMVANVGTSVNLETITFLDDLADKPDVNGMRGAVRMVLMAGIEHMQNCENLPAVPAAATKQAEKEVRGVPASGQ